jgi:hypothetical protein
MESVKKVATMLVETPGKPSIAFEMTSQAVSHNSSLLLADGYDFEKCVKSQKGMTMGYGSKCCPISQLQLILGQHPNFPELQRILADGMDYQFRSTIPEEP